MKKFLTLALAAVLAAGMMTGCGSAAPSNSSSAPADGSTASDAAPAPTGDTIKIGVLAPLTGSVSTYGTAVKNGLEMAKEEINSAGGILGKQVELLIEDEKGDVTEATNAYNKLLSQGIVALIGDVTSQPSNAVAQLAADPSDGTPMLTPTGTAANITLNGSNIFRTCFLDPFQGQIMATFASEKLGAKTAAIMYNSSSDYSQGLADSFKATAEAKGITVVSYEAYGDADTDFKSQLTNVVAANPDVLFLPDYYEKLALISAQARDAGFQGPMLGADGWDGVLAQLGDNTAVVDGCYFSNHYFVDDTDEKVATFVSNYEGKYNGEVPNAFAALGYDSLYIMKQAIEAAGSTDKAAITSALQAVSYSGVTGDMTFDENGDPIKKVAIIKLQDGAVTLDSKM